MASYNQPEKDEVGRNYIKANFNIKDVRYMHDSLSFYIQNGNQTPEEYERIMQIKNTFFAMLMEHSFHT
tara:strand:- start:358 stop:564 length:207 start_codon:yes stop_codon:yes gene_type:complete